MCLNKLSIIPRITLKPKVVYKVVKKSSNIDYETFYTGYKVHLGELYSGRFVSDDWFTSLFGKNIYSGFIHSYDESISEEILEEYKDRTYDNVALIKCEIPKFTLYYKGYFGEIASRKLKYIEEVKVLYNEK